MEINQGLDPIRMARLKDLKRMAGRRNTLWVVPTRRAKRSSPFTSTGWKVLVPVRSKDGKITIQDVSDIVSDITGLKWLGEGALETGYHYTINQSIENFTGHRFTMVLL